MAAVHETTEGIEPSTSSFEDWRSVQLSYVVTPHHLGGESNPDLQLGTGVLSIARPSRQRTRPGSNR